MNFKNYKSGYWIQQYQYKSFLPAQINQTWTWDDSLINILFDKAVKTLGELNAFTRIVPDVDLFINMHKIKEATSSSKIEGTQTNIDEAIQDKEFIALEKRDDWQEVQNYVNAMNYAIEKLVELPISNRLLKKIHKILLSGARGEHKIPGEFRRSQNWIGGSNISDAVFIPPHHNEVVELMGDLEKFIHNEEINVPHLIKIALIHYQFETIHPFLDGNGRIGRLLITLYLVSKQQLITPSLFLSDFFEKNRYSYYDALSRVRVSNDIIHWIKFFLNSVSDTAEKAILTFNNILKLKNQIDKKIVSLGRRAEKSRKLINYLYKKPVIDYKTSQNLIGGSKRAVQELIKTFEELNILKEYTCGQRNKRYAFTDYLAIF